MLQSAGLDPQRTAIWVGQPDGKTLLEHRADAQMNPASVMKLVTTAAALQTLGPQHVWQTQVDVQGSVNASTRTLQGNLILRGGGDPKLVVERLEPLMRQVREAGIDVIDGDILLDRRAFVVPERDPGEFDGEPLRPYNTRPDPLLINFKAVVMYFTPDPARQLASLRTEPPLSGVAIPVSVPLSERPCGDWRGGLGADFSAATSIAFTGSYPASCGERVWPVAFADPANHSARAIAGMWAQVGGVLKGQVQNAPNASPLLARPSRMLFQFPSAPLSEIVRDVNKLSNNVMAQHVFLALPKRASSAPITLADARRSAAQWWESAIAAGRPPVMDNGSGLSREERVSAQAIGRLLSHMRASEQASVFFASLPIAGVDGTLGSLRGSSLQGLAQLKTGSLRDANSLAGRFTTAAGQEKLFVAIYNGPRTAEARQAMYCLLQQQIFGAAKPTEGRNLCRR